MIVGPGEIESFAAEFDPQPLHLGGLVASRWHVAAVSMRLLVDSDLGLCGQAAGLGVQAMRWQFPVRAGDSLRLEGAVTETRASRSRADRGIVKFRVLVLNQCDEAVLEATHVVMVARRSVLPPGP